MDSEAIVSEMLRANDVVAELNERAHGGNYFWSYSTNFNLRKIVGTPNYYCIWYVEHGPEIVKEGSGKLPAPRFIFHGPISILERKAKNWPKELV